jgi:hypothetical protein
MKPSKRLVMIPSEVDRRLSLEAHFESGPNGPPANFCPRVSSHAMWVVRSRWLFIIGFAVRRGFGRFIALLVQLLMAVLMAVRCQLLCILLRWTARMTFATTHSYQIAYATFCDRLRLAAKLLKTDSKSAGPCGHGGSTPPPGTSPKLISNL